MIMRSIGLGLILAAVLSIFAGILFGEGVTLFIYGVIMGVIGNVLNWFGKRQMDKERQ